MIKDNELELHDVYVKSLHMVSKDGCSKYLKELENLFRIDNVNISTAEKNQVYDVLARHTKVISKGTHDLGEMRNVKHTIDTEGSRPIRVPYRRLPHRQVGT